MEHLQAINNANLEIDDDKAIVDRDGVILPHHLQQAILNGKHPLKVWRRHRDMSMGELAKLVNVSTATIFYIEKNNGPANTALMEELAKVLNAHPEGLIAS